MARQKFTAAEREAIWLAHGKKCAYSNQLLEVGDFHIDHIIPESFAEQPEEFTKVKAKYKLSADFDLFGYENLLPSKAVANSQKGALLFEPERVHFFLGIASSKKEEIEKQLQKINKRQASSRALVVLQQCLERGDLSPDEVGSILEKYGDKPQEIFPLIEGMQFVDAMDIMAVAKADIESLRLLPIRLGENDHISGVTLTNQSGETKIVSTCKEYDASISAGFFANSNFDIKMATYFEHQCGLLSALHRAEEPETSFISNPRVGITDIHLIPFSLFPKFEDEGLRQGVLETYQSKVDDGVLVIKKMKQNMVQIEEPEGMGQRLIEVARSDFNGDGIEDILLFEDSYATQGTMGFGRILILTRTSIDGIFEEVDTINL